MRDGSGGGEAVLLWAEGVRRERRGRRREGGKDGGELNEGDELD